MEGYPAEVVIEQMGVLVGYLEAAMEDEGRNSQLGNSDIINHIRMILKERAKCETETTIGEVVADVSFPSAYDVRPIPSPVQQVLSNELVGDQNHFILDSDSSVAVDNQQQTERPALACSSGHLLHIVRVGKSSGCTGFASHKCDVCGTAGLTHSIYRCELCDFDRCIRCEPTQSVSASLELDSAASSFDVSFINNNTTTATATATSIINHPAYDDL